jgi:hypothetical protein
MARHRHGRDVATCVLAALSLALTAGVASAHNVGGTRFDAPLPLSLLFAGAGGTVALTALWLAVTGRATADVGTRTVARFDSRPVRWLTRAAAAVFLAGVASAVVVGVVGRQVAAENFATVFTWPVWFRGLGLLAVLVGSPWRVLSPWRALYRGLCRLEGDELAVLAYPSWLGSWPAVAGFVVLVGVFENLTVVPQSPLLTTVLIAAYALLMLAGGVLFGPVWFDRADPLGVLYRLFGRVAAVSVERSREAVEISLRPPWQGCTSPVGGPAVVLFVVAAVYTVSFDGFTSTRQYQSLLFGARDLLGIGPVMSILLYVAGLVVFAGVFVLVVFLGETVALAGETDGRVTADGGRSSWPGAARSFAPTVLPIAAAYDVAHNYPYVVRSTARVVELGAQPLGVGVASLEPLGWLSVPAFWGSQVVLVVVGHVVAVVAAHGVAVERYPSLPTARRGHLPLLVLMVGYTVLSLWIISQPVVN